MVGTESFYGGELPVPYLKQLPTSADVDPLFVRREWLINAPLIEWGKRTSWEKGGFIDARVENRLKNMEKKERELKMKNKNKRKRVQHKTAEEFFIEKHCLKYKDKGLSELELVECAKRKWAKISDDDTNDDVRTCKEHEANQKIKVKKSKSKKPKHEGDSDREEDNFPHDDDSSSDEEEEDEAEGEDEKARDTPETGLAMPTPAQKPTEVKRNRLRKVNQSPPAAKAKPAPAREQRPSPRRGERTPAPAAPGSAGRKSARSTGRAASVRSVRTQGPLAPALTAAAAAAYDDLATPKDLIMRDGTAMTDPYAFPDSSEGFTVSPAPPKLGLKGKKQQKRTPPSAGATSASPQVARKAPKKLALDKA